MVASTISMAPRALRPIPAARLAVGDSPENRPPMKDPSSLATMATTRSPAVHSSAVRSARTARSTYRPAVAKKMGANTELLNASMVWRTSSRW